MEKSRYLKATCVTYLAMLLEGGLANIIGVILVMLALKFGKNPEDIPMLVTLRGLGCMVTLYLAV